MKLKLSDDAKKDFKGIMIYTKRQWGLRQAQIYKDKLNKGFRAILDNPHIGREKDYFEGCRCFNIERHVVFYRPLGHAVEVVRILHSDMDAGRQ